MENLATKEDLRALQAELLQEIGSIRDEMRKAESENSQKEMSEFTRRIANDISFNLFWIIVAAISIIALILVLLKVSSR